MDGVADISMTSLKIGPERSTAIDFSVPFIETGITIIVYIKKGVISATAFLGKCLNTQIITTHKNSGGMKFLPEEVSAFRSESSSTLSCHNGMVTWLLTVFCL